MYMYMYIHIPKHTIILIPTHLPSQHTQAHTPKHTLKHTFCHTVLNGGRQVVRNQKYRGPARERTVSVRLTMWKFFALPVSRFRMAATASLGPLSVTLMRSHTSKCSGKLPALAALSVARSAGRKLSNSRQHSEHRTRALSYQ